MKKTSHKQNVAQKKAARRQPKESGDANLNQFLDRIQTTLSSRDNETRCYIVSIPVLLRDKESSGAETSLDVTENLMKRLQNKAKSGDAYLANPRNEDGIAIPLFIDELTKDVRNKNLSDFSFSANDVLYISGHSNFFIFSNLSPQELAKQYVKFLDKTGIKTVKLAGCHTGSRFYEGNLPPLSVHEPEELLSSYAQKFSQELSDLDLPDIVVYGYRGGLSDDKEKNRGAREGYHSYVTMGFFSESTKRLQSHEVRGSEASVRFKNGVLYKEPKIVEDNFVEYDSTPYRLTF